MNNIAIIIPAYNEVQTITRVIDEFHAKLPDAQIVVVDNNSTDGTGEHARRALGELSCKGCVIREPRQGKAHAMRRGFAETSADVYVMVDADCTYPAAQLHELLAPVLAGEADMTVGDRLSGGNYSRENTRMFHQLGNALVLQLINAMFRSNLHDIMSGYRAMSRTFVDNYPILCHGFEIETEMTLHALDKRFQIVEIPIEYKNRPAGSVSKLNTLADGMLVVKTIVTIFKDYKPMMFWGACALLLSCAGLAVSVPVFIWYHHTSLVRIPLAVLATGLMITSLISFSIGAILATVVELHRFEYEMNVKRYVAARKNRDQTLQT